MRLSVTVRNPDPYDQCKVRVGAATFSQPWDIEHVRQKLPNLEPILCTRLGTALTQRRQFLQYRKEHHDWSEGALDIQINDNGREGRGTTVASSLPQDLSYIRHAQSSTSVEESHEDRSEISATSYASSSGNQGEFRVPDIPTQYNVGPFICPFCYMLISMETGDACKTQQQWK